MTHQGANAPSVTSVAQHKNLILSATRKLPAVSVTLSDALNRTLAEDLVARVAVPGFDNSAMDGYALRQEDAASASPDAPVELLVVADLHAGSAANPSLVAGRAARIMTGAAVPDDADCVVPLEQTDAGTKSVLIFRAPTPAENIRRAGSDVRAGDTVLTAGRTLSAQDLAAAAAAGAGSLRVHPAPRVGVLSTGSELRPAGEPLEHGQIHDSNSVLLAAAVAACGSIPVQLGSVPDDEDALHTLLERVAPTVDVIVTTGGVSVGAYDVVKAVLAPLGVWFGPVRMQPGRPQGFGEWRGRGAEAGTPVFALPGNPVAAFVSFEVFVRPALLTLQGRNEVTREVLRAAVSAGWSSPNGRAQFMPAVVERHRDGTLTVRPASSGGSGSSLVASLARANALAAVDETVTEVRVGDLLDVTLIR